MWGSVEPNNILLLVTKLHLSWFFLHQLAAEKNTEKKLSSQGNEEEPAYITASKSAADKGFICLL